MTTRRPSKHYTLRRDGFDGYKRLGSAVIIQAVRDLESDNSIRRKCAEEFFRGSEVLDFFVELAGLPDGYIDQITHKVAS